MTNQTLNFQLLEWQREWPWRFRHQMLTTTKPTILVHMRIRYHQLNLHDSHTDLKFYIESKAFVDRSYIFYRDMNTLHAEIRKRIISIDSFIDNRFQIDILLID